MHVDRRSARADLQMEAQTSELGNGIDGSETRAFFLVHSYDIAAICRFRTLIALAPTVR